MSLADLKPGDAVCVEVFGYRHSEAPKVSDWIVDRVARKYMYASAASGWPKNQAFEISTGAGKDFRARAHASREELMKVRGLSELRERAYMAMRKATDLGRRQLNEQQCLTIIETLEPTP